MRELKRNIMVESDHDRFFNGYSDETVPDVPYAPGGHPQYNPMIVNDRIELMNDVIRELEDYWYSEDPKLEDKVTRFTNRDELLYVSGISWSLENPDVVTVKFRLAGVDGSNDRLVEKREIEINFEDFLGHNIEGGLVKFISKRIESLLDSVLHGGLYKENRKTKEPKRGRKFESEMNPDAHQDYAIQDVKEDLEILLDIWEDLRKTQYKEGNIQNIMILIRNIIAFVISAYKIECSVGKDGNTKNVKREAELSYLKAQLEAEKLVSRLTDFDHKFVVKP